MAKSFETNSDMRPDTSDIVCDNIKDFSGDLASNDGVDLNADDTAKSESENADQVYESSARERILTAGAEGINSPSDLAQGVSAWRSPPGAENVYAQGLQAAWNMGVVGSNEFMEATIRQHGNSPAVELNNLQIQQEINNASNYQGEPLNEHSNFDENGVDITDEKLRDK